MAGANPKRTINANILLYGPKGAGKTSNLRFIQRKLKPEQRGDIEAHTQEGSPEVVYEYLPIQLGLLMGYDTNLFIYTVPDGEEALETRLSLLPNAAGVAFIAHSGADATEENQASLEALKEELQYFGMSYADLPILFQYNHRDAKDAVAIEALNAILNPEGHQVFEAVASAGEGVRSTFSAISKLAVRRVRLQLIQEQQEAGAASLTQAETASEVSISGVVAPASGRATESESAPPVLAPPDIQAPEGAEPPPVARAVKTSRKVEFKDVDLETSGEFRRVNSEEFLSTDFGAYMSSEPIVLETMEAVDDDDDDEDLSMGPTTLTAEERARLGAGGGSLGFSLDGDTDADGDDDDDEEAGGLMLHDIPAIGAIPLSSAGAGALSIQTYAEEDDDEEKINLLGRTSQLDEASFFMEEARGGELELELEDELALDFEEALSESELDEAPLEPIDDALLESEVDEETQDEPLDSDDAFDDVPSEEGEALHPGSSLDMVIDDVESGIYDDPPLPDFDDLEGDAPSELGDDEDEGLTLPEDRAVPVAPPMADDEDDDEGDRSQGSWEGSTSELDGFGVEDESDDEAGPSTIAITSIPELGADESDVAAAAASGSDHIDAGALEITRWGEVRRVDGETLILPVTVSVPTLGREITLEVTLSARALLGEAE